MDWSPENRFPGFGHKFFREILPENFLLLWRLDKETFPERVACVVDAGERKSMDVRRHRNIRVDTHAVQEIEDDVDLRAGKIPNAVTVSITSQSLPTTKMFVLFLHGLLQHLRLAGDGPTPVTLTTSEENKTAIDPGPKTRHRPSSSHPVLNRSKRS